MQDEANIVKQYEEANVSGRIEILIKYYPNFIRLVEGYEQSLSFIIKEEKAYKAPSGQGRTRSKSLEEMNHVIQKSKRKFKAGVSEIKGGHDSVFHGTGKD